MSNTPKNQAHRDNAFEKPETVKQARVHPKDAAPGAATVRKIPTTGTNRWRKGG